MAGNGEKDSITVTPKALASFIVAVAVSFSGGYISKGGEAQAGQASDVAVAVLTRRMDDYERINDKRLERIEANMVLLVNRTATCEPKR